MIHAVILPGMDGSGQLLADTIAELEPEIAAVAVAYPGDRALGYGVLAEIAARTLPQRGPFLLIAESFSGPVAVRLAAAHPDRLLGLVFCASFAKAPRIPKLPFPSAALGRIGARLPIDLAPSALLDHFMMGRWSTPAWRARLDNARRAVQARVLRQRMREATQVDELARLRTIPAPILYLLAKRDRIITAASWRAIQDAAPHAECVEVDGPHFLFQAKPSECADAIKRWAARTTTATSRDAAHTP